MQQADNKADEIKRNSQTFRKLQQEFTVISPPDPTESIPQRSKSTAALVDIDPKKKKIQQPEQQIKQQKLNFQRINKKNLDERHEKFE